MEKTPLYQEIAESIRQEILYGSLAADDELPTVREMSERWGCAPGTVQRAYKELARQGLVMARPGQGTRVGGISPAEILTPLRRATLINQAESFLLSVLSAGYAPDEVEGALRLALDRWRIAAQEAPSPPHQELRFVGSHDPAISLLTSHLRQTNPTFQLQITFSGSLGGLIALARGEADLAGCHLWDEETDTYNKPYVQRLLPGRRMALLRLANRHLGLLTAADNPLQIQGLEDLARPGIHFINRQSGAGTRVWLDAQLRQLNIQADPIQGYQREAQTHSEVASAIAEGQAEVGLGIETVALAYGLDYLPLTTECYDIIIPEEGWTSELSQALVSGLNSTPIQDAIQDLGGYDISHTGQVQWVE